MKFTYLYDGPTWERAIYWPLPRFAAFLKAFPRFRGHHKWVYEAIACNAKQRLNAELTEAQQQAIINMINRGPVALKRWAKIGHNKIIIEIIREMWWAELHYSSSGSINGHS